MVASLCGLRELIRRDPAPYRNLAHYFTNILKQVGRLAGQGLGGVVWCGEEKSWPASQSTCPAAKFSGHLAWPLATTAATAAGG